MKLKKPQNDVILFAVLTAILISLISIESSIFDRKFYSREFEALGVYHDLGNEAPENVTTSLLDYYSGKTSSFESNHLEANEISHLNDVNSVMKSIFFTKKIFAFFWVVAGGFFVFRKKDEFLKFFGESFYLAGIILFLIVGVLFISSLFFGAAFTFFHQIFFPQGNWAFPADSVLIRIYPRQFFLDFFIKIIFKILVYGVVIMLTGKLIQRVNSRK